MHIKQIIIQGFKSYKEQTIVEPFSPVTNVVVGRNGSGKSNFFAAIRFVLSDAYHQPNREERQALLHEGTGSAIMSAYVEIIFDNTDGRFPNSNDDFVLRRTIGLRRDEYSIDRKVVPKANVVEMLETAGFSKSNPYYIVPQGRVSALTNMKEPDRLKLLKEVAGTQVYEQRRTESLKIIIETTMKREKIEDLLVYIEGRLAELSEEKEELKAFLDKDRERRCLEYGFYHSEQVAIDKALEGVENMQQEDREVLDSSQVELADCKDIITRLDGEMQELQTEIERLEIDRKQLHHDRRQHLKLLAAAELKLKSLAEVHSEYDQAKSQHSLELEAVKSLLASKKAELAEISPQHDQYIIEEDNLRRDLESTEASFDLLVAKQDHGSRFKTRKARDGWLRGQIEEVKRQISAQDALWTAAQTANHQKEENLRHMKESVQTMEANMDDWRQKRARVEEEFVKVKEVFQKLDEERKLIRRGDDKLDRLIHDALTERDTAECELVRTMDKTVAQGLAHIKRLTRDRDFPGAYGTIADLMRVSDLYHLPIEQTAAGSLFHYVVDNAETASRLASALHMDRWGRITFVPLEEIQPTQVHLPQAADVVPLMSKIQYDPKYEKAFQQVFGKTVVCPNLTIAGQYTRDYGGIHAITPDGDTSNERGAMTGGFLNANKGKMKLLQLIHKWRDEHERLVAQAGDSQKQLEVKDQEATRSMGECQKLELKLRCLDCEIEPLRAQFRSSKAIFEEAQRDFAMISADREAHEATVRQHKEALADLEAELGSDFKKALNDKEDVQLAELSTRVKQLQNQLAEACRTRRQLKERIQLLRVEVEKDLRARLDELNGKVLDESPDLETNDDLGGARLDFESIQKTGYVLNAKVKDMEAKIKEVKDHIEGLVGEKSAQEKKLKALAVRVEKDEERLEKNLQQAAILTSQGLDCAKSIQGLGVLPDEAFSKYEGLESKVVVSRMKKVMDSLKEFKHVNKKAFEQYNSFTVQRNVLLERSKGLEGAQKSIQELVDHLDQQKDEAIERTFKQVSKEFTTMFERLVPAGRGRLIIMRRADRQQNPDNSDGEDGREASVENYIGVGISVSFNSKNLDDQQKIQQLSGGQKSLCALCLIFALQRTESSPMVIFDEIDANLDGQYRAAVAQLMHDISREAGTQFICTTFRPEILQVAEKCYGVTFRHKASSIACVSAEEALSFVEGDK